MRFNTRSSFLCVASAALFTIPKLVSGALIPNADTPVFFLVGLDSFGDSLNVSPHPYLLSYQRLPTPSPHSHAPCLSSQCD